MSANEVSSDDGEFEVGIGGAGLAGVEDDCGIESVLGFESKVESASEEGIIFVSGEDGSVMEAGVTEIGNVRLCVGETNEQAEGHWGHCFHVRKAR